MKSFKLQNYIVNPDGKISKRMIYKDSKIAGFMLNIAKGSSLPNHTHFDSTVLVQVIQGNAETRVDDETISIAAGDLLQVEGQEKLSVNNTGDGTLSLYVTLSPNPPSEQYTVDLDI